MSADTPAKVPTWLSDQLQSYRDQAGEISDVLHLACRGISMVRGLPNTIKVLADINEVLGDNKEQGDQKTDEIEDAKAQAELAERELENGFPLLHAQAVVSLWGALEALVKNILAAWLANDEDARSVEAVKKLRVTIWEYESMSLTERSLHSVDLLERDISAPLKLGIARFESLLQIANLGGPVGEEVRKDIFEMHQVRNVLVHLRGFADRRLVEACPWLGLSVGDHVKVTHADFARYNHSAIKYFFTIRNRIRLKYGLEPFWPFEEEDKLQAEPTPPS